MKLLYIGNIRLPTEKAHGLQIMQNCEAFADAGADVSLWAAQRVNTPALRDISDLVARGVLQRSDAGGRSTSYELGETPEWKLDTTSPWTAGA